MTSSIKIVPTAFAFALLVALILPAILHAQEGEEIEEVEEVEVIEVVTPLTSGKENWGEAAGSLSAPVVIGRIHPALVHFPVAWIVLLVLFELFALIKKQSFHPLGTFLAALAFLSTLPAVLSGLLRADELEQLRPSTALVIDHRNVMIAVSALVLMALVVRVLWKKADKKVLKFVYYGVLLAAFVLVLHGGHLGGQLVFGKEFLPF